MTEQTKLTIGQAIDQVEQALRTFDAADQHTILTAVCTHLKIAFPSAWLGATPSAATEPRGTIEETATVPQNSNTGMDIKSLRTLKHPSSASQMACLVAYYLMEVAPVEEAKQSVKVADIDKYFKQAGYKLPEKLEQLLIDAKRSGYFEPVGRGEYKLTRVGYNLVTHGMPSKPKD